MTDASKALATAIPMIVTLAGAIALGVLSVSWSTDDDGSRACSYALDELMDLSMPSLWFVDSAEFD